MMDDGGGYDNDDAILNKNSYRQYSLQKRSSLAKDDICEYAVNGGLFQSYPTGKAIHKPLDRVKA